MHLNPIILFHFKIRNMKNLTSIFLVICSCLFFGFESKAQLSEGFESGCSNHAYSFYYNCHSNWINTNGSADTYSNYSGISAAEGSRYVHMYSRWKGSCTSNRSQTEGIAVNQSFQAGNTYTVTFAMRWKRNSYCNSFKVNWVLTNNKSNKYGNANCTTGGATPNISSSDQVVWTKNPGSTPSGWTYYTVTFTPNNNYSQLWLRNETKNYSSCSSSGDYLNELYIDDFEIVNCSSGSYTTNFYIATTSNNNGNVTATGTAYYNSIPVKHCWDVYYATNGSTSGNTEVPGIPSQCFITPSSTSSATFNQNLYINTWYYIKHGIWNDCISWRETRKRFRVRIGYYRSGDNEPQYVVDVEDVPFEPSQAYTDLMTQRARNGEFESNDLNFAIKSSSKTGLFESSIVSQNFPNPFNTMTTISFVVDQEAPVSIIVRNADGKQIEELLGNELKSVGTHNVEFDGSSYPPGIYYYFIKIGDKQMVKKMILLK